MIALQHFAGAPVSLDRERLYVQPDPSPYEKPRGFWVSVPGEDDWPAWCRAESFGEGRLQVAHDVSLAIDAKVLTLESAAALDAFTSEYGVPRTMFLETLGRNSTVMIDWQRVAAQCDGLIIAPYQWSRRLNLDWYYGWDVASGCIWNAAAIESVTPATLYESA